MRCALDEPKPQIGPNTLFPSLAFMCASPNDCQIGHSGTAQTTPKRGQKAHPNFEGGFRRITRKTLIQLAQFQPRILLELPKAPSSILQSKLSEWQTRTSAQEDTK